MSRISKPRSARKSAPPAQAKRLIRLNNGFQLLFNLLWWMPVFYQYQRDAGLSDAQIFAIQGAYYVSFCVLEIPTGFLADRIGHRRALQLGAAVMVAANLIPVASPSVTGFLLHFLTIATARSLVSGAASAYLYESLHARGAGAHYVQAEGTARSIGLWAKIGCWPLVGVLMQMRQELPYVLTAVCALGALACAIALPRLAAPTSMRTAPAPSAATGPADGEREGKGTGLLTSLFGALAVFRRSSALGPLMLQGVALFTLARICQVNLFQPLLIDKDVPLTQHGAILSAMTVAEAVASARPEWLRRRLADTTSVTVLSLVLAFTLAATTVAGGAGTVVWLCLFAAATGLAFPIQRNLVNSAIPDSRHRATLLSLESMLDRGVCALAAVAVGAYLAADRLDALLVHSALGTCVLLAAVALVLRRLRRRGAPGLAGRASLPAPRDPAAGDPAPRDATAGDSTPPAPADRRK
ncbi:MFS transporter [Streptomyces sp. DSM 42041]|uniref:MFS transporter n=1 Tax=Streptomyces hazeniae TaxID=3075538 RepID=A0ABU2NS35_9ACTN|nr:MFS transporter [Streptomyces sp. DSM 42041]MDT0379797.1 MFS transporter [Streptomyces sp. DSM 42041]